MENLLFSINATLPIFLMVLAGVVLRRRNVIGDDFVDKAGTVAFQLALPCSVFKEMLGSSSAQSEHPGVYIYAALTMLGAIGLMMVIIPRFFPDRGVAGAVIHGAYRSSYAYVAVPLSLLMFGESGSGPAVIMLAVILPIYNVMAVVVLTTFGPQSQGKGAMGRVVRGIVTNPLILAVVLGLGVEAVRLPLPTFATTTINFFSGMAAPLALIALGGQINFGKVRGNLRPVLTASLIKLVVLPLLFLPPALQMGFTPQELGALFLLYAAPTTVSSFAMAKGMNSNSELAGQILLMSTLLSSVTLFLGIFLLRGLGAV